MKEKGLRIAMQPYVLTQVNDRALTGRAFEEQIVPIRKRIFNLALRMLGNRSDAEDIVQETLVRAWSGRAGYDPARSLDAWMLRIATNLCIDQIRRRQRRPPQVSLETPYDAESESGCLEPADLSRNPERMLLSNEIDEKLQMGIASLP